MAIIVSKYYSRVACAVITKHVLPFYDGDCSDKKGVFYIITSCMIETIAKNQLLTYELIFHFFLGVIIQTNLTKSRLLMLSDEI